MPPSPSGSTDLLGGQVYVFLLSILAGDAVGLLYDLFRATLHPGRRRGWAADLLDLLFWLLAALLLAVAMILGNWLEFRLYPLLGAAAGLALYFGLASPVVYGALVAVRRAAVQALQGFLGRLAHRWVGPLRRRLGGSACRAGRRLLRRLPRPSRRWRRLGLRLRRRLRGSRRRRR
ncbi:MAG: spore cortex biosynthesis protein YabQ [Bacillota bacterium]|nr:spore cortex biosynthesis protein YabQ [Bacillota bacterium]